MENNENLNGDGVGMGTRLDLDGVGDGDRWDEDGVDVEIEQRGRRGDGKMNLSRCSFLLGTLIWRD